MIEAQLSAADQPQKNGFNGSRFELEQGMFSPAGLQAGGSRIRDVPLSL
jgi:hypothetical protein